VENLFAKAEKSKMRRGEASAFIELKPSHPEIAAGNLHVIAEGNLFYQPRHL